MTLETAVPYTRFRAVAGAGGAVLLCLACVPPPEPPLPADLDGTDPAVVALFESRAAEVRRAPRDASSWRRLGMAYHGNGRLELARECYRQSLALEPGDAQVRYFQALAEERLGRLDEAVAGLRRVLELDAGYAPAHWRLGLWLLDLGDVESARRSIERAVALAPEDRAARLALAKAHLQASRAEAAAELLEDLLESDPADGYARFLLGRAYRQLGRDVEAGRSLAAGRGEPRWSDPWSEELDAERAGFRAAVDAAVARLGPAPERAVAELERLRGQAPDQVGLLINLGIGYRRLERLEDSARVLVEAVRLQPGRPLAHLHLAVTYGAMSRQAGDPALLERALTHAERAIELRPESPKGYAVRADLLAAAGRVDDAVETFRRAADLDSEGSLWLYQAAALLSRNARWRQAIPLLERALEDGGDDPEALFLLGASLANSGRLAEAAAALERARRLAPEDPKIVQALEQLRRARGAETGG